MLDFVLLYEFLIVFFFFFFFNDTATTEIYTLSLHDALPISIFTRQPPHAKRFASTRHLTIPGLLPRFRRQRQLPGRSEEHTSELQSPCNLVCRLLLEKKKKNRSISRRPPM